MIRQARRYLVGAVSSVTLISIAIVAFVVLVSAQVFTEWPIAALGGGNDQAAVSTASALSGQKQPAVAAKTVNPDRGGPVAAAPAGPNAARGEAGDRGGAPVTAPEDNASVNSGAPPATESAPVSGAPQSGSETSPSEPSAPALPTSTSAPAHSAPSSSGGGSATGVSSGAGSGGSNGSGGGSKPPGNVVAEVVEPVTSGSTTAKVTETVNSTVDTVDETVTGGALEETGVTGLSEEVVDGVVGPESALGKPVDETVNAVGGLLGANR